jgi:threonylcarbamoyladenosine tRNA methylthiotransferase MtaB
MGRPYDTREYARVVADAREALPGLAVSTDVIAGFPGETDAEAAYTREFVEERGFSRLHVFRFSRRPGTPAAEMSAQVPPAAIAARAGALREAGARAAAVAASAREGSVAEVLVERVRTDVPGETMVAEGVTREYLRVRVPVSAAAAGALLRVRLTRATADGTCGAVLLNEGDAGERERVRGHGAC